MTSVKQKFSKGILYLLPRRLREVISTALDGRHHVPLFTAFQVAIKENLAPKGFLDYKRGKIFMDLSSSMELVRLHACRKEPETVEWIETHLKSGEVFYDIGANVGAYSFVAQKVSGGKSTIYALEPSFSTFAALCRNIKLNHCDSNIIPLQIALSSETKLTPFHYASIDSGGSLHSLGTPSNFGGASSDFVFQHPVLTYRLDDLIQKFGLKPPSHMKIDVDGGELGLIEGALRTLRDSRLRSVLIEISPEESERIIMLIKNSGLRLVSKHPRKKVGVYNYIFER